MAYARATRLSPEPPVNLCAVRIAKINWGSRYRAASMAHAKQCASSTLRTLRLGMRTKYRHAIASKTTTTGLLPGTKQIGFATIADLRLVRLATTLLPAPRRMWNAPIE